MRPCGLDRQIVVDSPDRAAAGNSGPHQQAMGRRWDVTTLAANSGMAGADSRNLVNEEPSSPEFANRQGLHADSRCEDKVMMARAEVVVMRARGAEADPQSRGRHTICAIREGQRSLHKVTIVPRGRHSVWRDMPETIRSVTREHSSELVKASRTCSGSWCSADASRRRPRHPAGDRPGSRDFAGGFDEIGRFLGDTSRLFMGASADTRRGSGAQRSGSWIPKSRGYKEANARQRRTEGAQGPELQVAPR